MGGIPAARRASSGTIAGADDFADFANKLADPSKEAGVDLLIGQPVYITNLNVLAKARADARTTIQIAGIVSADTLAGFAAPYRRFGSITRSDWTPIIGTVSLSINAKYCVSPAAAGLLLTTPPSTPGTFVAWVGRAISDQTLALEIEPAILM